jgi:hypothetical protein
MENETLRSEISVKDLIWQWFNKTTPAALI